MRGKLIFFPIVATLSAWVVGTGPAFAAGHSGGHVGGMHAGAARGSMSASHGSFGRSRPSGRPSVGTGVIRHPGAIVTPGSRGGAGWPYYYGYGGLGLGFGLYDYGAYDDPWWGVGPYAYDPYALPPDDEAVEPEPMGGVRLDVSPKSAEVFVDGARAGIVDDFNGHFQQLKLPAGPHRLELRAPGYASATFDVEVQPGQTMKLRDTMSKG